MAYAEIYYFSLTSINQARQYTVTIEKEGFAGYSKEITIFPGRAPVTLEYDREDLIFKPVRSSTLTVTISTKESGLTVDELVAFVSAEARDYRLTLTETVGTGTQTLWVGWLQPMEQLTLDLFNLGEMSLIFVDGLVHLRNLNVPYEIKDAFGFDKVKEIIRQCLLKTGHTFDIQWINSIVDSSDTTAAIWDKTSFQRAALLQEGTGGYIDSLKALELICAKYGVTLYQAYGQWYIQNFLEGQAEEGKGALMQSDGTGGDTLQWYSRNITGLLTSRNFLARNGQARLLSPLSTATAKADYLSNRHGQPNWNFATWTNSGTYPDGWGGENALVTQQATPGEGSPYSVNFQGYYSLIEPAAERALTNSVLIPVEQGDKIIFAFKWTFLANIGENIPLNRVGVFFDADTGNPADDRWLDDAGDWQASATKIEGDDSDALAVGNLIIDVPAKGTLQVYGYNPEATSATGESQTAYYTQLNYLGLIVIKEAETNEEDPKAYNKYKSILQKTTIADVFSNGSIEPIQVLGYQSPSAVEMPDPLITEIESQQFLAIERNSDDNNEPYRCFIQSLYQISPVIGTPNTFTAYQVLKFIRSNRFIIQGDFFGAALQIGNSYTFEIFTGETRTFICTGYIFDLKNDITTTALLVECNMETLTGTTTQTIYE